MKDKRQDIDGLKGIAILAVVFYHLFDLLKSGQYTESTLFDGGFLGVDIWWILRCRYLFCNLRFSYYIFCLL